MATPISKLQDNALDAVHLLICGYEDMLGDRDDTIRELQERIAELEATIDRLEDEVISLEKSGI